MPNPSEFHTREIGLTTSDERIVNTFLKSYQDTIDDFAHRQSRILERLRHGLGKVSIPIEDDELAIEAISKAFCNMLLFRGVAQEQIYNFITTAVKTDRTQDPELLPHVLTALENALNVITGSKFHEQITKADVIQSERAVRDRRDTLRDHIIIALDRSYENKVNLIKDLTYNAALSNEYRETDNLPLTRVNLDVIEPLVEKGDIISLRDLLKPASSSLDRRAQARSSVRLVP